MQDTEKLRLARDASIGRLSEISVPDLEALCQATRDAIVDGNGFGWLRVPEHSLLASYWRGVVLIPERELYVARLEGRIVGSAQMVHPPRNNEAQAHAVSLETFFVAPWARGRKLAQGLLETIEHSARRQNYRQINLAVRETQTAAIELYERTGYRRWGVNPDYAMVEGRMVAGYFYTRRLQAVPGASAGG